MSRSLVLPATAAIAVSVAIAPPAIAQLVPDTTLPNNSTVIPTPDGALIDGGSSRGSNLFHSFQEFSLPTGTAAFFNNSPAIENIITRVTGGEISNIDGILGANGTANVFLLNPNGIVFGENARLAIGGSFLATTAESLHFADGFEFSARTPDVGSPLLTLNVPVGLQFGSDPGSIQVLGSFQDTFEVPKVVGNLGESLAILNTTTLNLLRRPANLTVPPGETLTLAGGEIVIERAKLFAPGGRIVLGSVGPQNAIGITPAGDLTFDRAREFRDIRIHDSATLDASGNGGGRLHLRGRYLSLTDDAVAIAFNRGDESNSFSGIEIQGDKLAIQTESSLSSRALQSGDSGDVTIEVETLDLSDTAFISTSTSGAGNAGSLVIRAADAISVANTSSIASSSFGLGTGGSLKIETRQLTLSDTGNISSAALGLGAGGEIEIRAFESAIVNPGLRGTTANAPGAIFGNGIFSTTSQISADAGNISIATDRLILDLSSAAIPEMEASISSATSGAGAGGTITIQANVLEAIGLPIEERSVRISAQGEATASGSAGSIMLFVNNMLLSQGAQILVGNSGSGNAGIVSIDAETLTLEAGAAIAASTVSGAGGNIMLDADSLFLQGGSQIATDAGSTDGGNIRIDTDVLVGLENSDITANAIEGNGGSIEISSRGIFGLEFRSERTPQSDITASSQFGVEGTVTFTNPDVDPANGLVALNSEPIAADNLLARRCRADRGDRGRLTLAGRGGIPSSPESAPHDETLFLARLAGAIVLDKASSESENRQNEKILAAIRNAQEWRSQGFYRRALEGLEPLAKALDSDSDLRVSATVWRHYGITLGLTGEREASREALQRSLEIARAIGSDDDIGAALLGLGNLWRAREERDRALHYYQRSAERAIAPSLKLQALLNQFGLAIETRQLELALDLQAPIRAHFDALPPSRTSVYSTLHYADRLLDVSPQNPDIDALLDLAERQAKTAQDARSLAYVLGLRGRVYERREQWQQAREVTERALFLSQNLDAPDLEYQWQWQLGRIFREWGDRASAIAAYTDAVANLQSLRSDLASVGTETQFSFRDRVEPVYRQLVSLLLDGESPAQENLQQARSLIEALQVAQLDNFFRDDCSQATPVQVDRIDPKAAVVYPIVLRDRLAVIVSIAGQPLRYYSHPVGNRQLISTVRELRELLADPQNPRPVLVEQTSQQIYNWLVEPLTPQLERQGIETLVFVLDGVLRNLPMSALFDGENYLIERYNVAIAPGLELLASEPLRPQGLNLLAGGISQARQGFPDLPGVKLEIENITDRIERSRALLDEEFTTPELQAAIARQPLNILHLATHGQFGATAEETFILTWEDRLDVRELGELLQGYARRDAIELLVLSACETAAGDERAVLGIAGVAVRSGARTTLAGLWPLDDATAVAFTDRFYRALAEPGTTKAEAFRQAQRELMNDDRFSSPFFWAPFVLVGNWQ